MRRRPPRSPLSLALAALAGAGCLDSPPDTGGGPDGDGGVDPGSADAARGDAGPDFDCPGNLVVNPSFENGAGGWLPNYATVTTVADAPLGSKAAEVCSDGRAEVDGYYSLDDEPDTVAEPATGEIYDLAVWVRAGPQDGPQVLVISVREYDEDGAPHPSSTPFTPDTTWQRVTSTLTVASPAPQRVDVYVASNTTTEGNCFQVDAFCLVRRQ